MKRLLYVIGVDGYAAARCALEGVESYLAVYPFVHHKYPNGIHLGWYDRLPDNRGRGLGAVVLDFLKEGEPETVLVTGPYLANDIFFSEVKRQGYGLTVTVVASPRNGEAELEVAGRWANEALWWIDGNDPLAVVAARLRLHPVVERLRKKCAFCEGSCGKRAGTPTRGV